MYILDIEASGTGDDSYPVEIAWIRLDGAQSFSTLINPDSVTGWDSWSSEATLHGLTRDECCERGETVAYVARRVFQLMKDYPVFSDSPEQDQKWLEKLLSSAGYPCPERLMPIETMVPKRKRRGLKDRLCARPDAHTAAANCLMLSKEVRRTNVTTRGDKRIHNTGTMSFKWLKDFSFVT